MKPYRQLLVAGLNRLVEAHPNILAPPFATEGNSESGHIFCDIAGRKSVVLWQGIGFDEVRISVWWNYDHNRHPQENLQGYERENFRTSSPLAKKSRYREFVGATVSGWLERKTSIHLQGNVNERLIDQYCRIDMKDPMKDLHEEPRGFKATGKTFF